VTKRLATVAVVAVGLTLLLASSGSTRAIKDGGTFRVGIPASFVPSVDAILESNLLISRATCASLMAVPDKASSEVSSMIPEIAAGDPVISADGKTYTVAIRKGLRFSTGAPVTARDVVHTINRMLSKKMDSPIAPIFSDIVGAQAVIDGKAETASGVSARAGALTIRLERPQGDFTTRMTNLCVVPRTLPIDPEGARAPVPTAGPYYVAQYVSGLSAVLERNPYYRGARPHHVDRFVIDLSHDAQTVLDRVDSGQLDYGFVSNQVYAPRAAEFTKKYGVNKSRFFAVPGTFIRMFVLNTSSPLFRNNVELRQAVNFAADRRALLAERGPLAGYLTDQFLYPGLLGFRNDRIYPLKAPNLRKASLLAKGRTRGGKAVLYVPDTPVTQAQAQILQYDLAKIGLKVDIEAFPAPVLFEKLATPGEPFDIGWIGWGGEPGDPGLMLSPLFDGRTIGQQGFQDYSYFDSAKYNRRLDHASTLIGQARYQAYGELDVQLSRDAAPAIPYAYDRTMNLVSQLTGCVVLNPNLDLAAVCLK